MQQQDKKAAAVQADETTNPGWKKLRTLSNVVSNTKFVQNRLNSNVDRPLSQRRDKPGDEH
jgi:hypothetical protein